MSDLLFSSVIVLKAANTYNSPHVSGKYVAIVKEGSRKGCLEISDKEVNPVAGFVVEKDKNSTDGLVHIRSSYNNKYWRSERESSDEYLVAAAEKKEDDCEKWNCTRFEPKFFDSYTKVAFFHDRCTEFGGLVKRAVAVNFFDGRLQLQAAQEGQLFHIAQLFHIINMDSMVKLPKRVTFKGDNGMYLRYYRHDKHDYNQFSAENSLEKVTHYEIFYTDNGDIRVKSLHNGKYWRRSPNWIRSDSTDANVNSDNLDTLFEPVRVGTDVIALRNRGNGRFCKRLNADRKHHCLNAGAEDIELAARLEVEEPVIDRKIEVHYRLEDAIIHESNTVELANSSSAENPDTHLSQQLAMELTFTKTKVSTWNKVSSLTLGTKATFSAGVPETVQSGLEISAEVKDEIQFGGSNDFSKEIKTTYTVTVPPRTKAIVKVIATQAKYDIPFSYTQTDTYSTGEIVTTTLEDGVYHGVEAYDVKYEIKEEPL